MLPRKFWFGRHLLNNQIRYLASIPSPQTKTNVELYQVLEISPDATLTEIREGYFRKVKQLHPDINPAPEAKAQFELVVEAYKILSNVDRRVGYDRSMKAGSKVYQESETPSEREQRLRKKKEDTDVFYRTKKELTRDKKWSHLDEYGSGARNLKLDPYWNRMSPEEKKALQDQNPIVKRVNRIFAFGKSKGNLILDNDKNDLIKSGKSAAVYLGLSLIFYGIFVYIKTDDILRP